MDIRYWLASRRGTGIAFQYRIEAAVSYGLGLRVKGRVDVHLTTRSTRWTLLDEPRLDAPYTSASALRVR